MHFVWIFIDLCHEIKNERKGGCSKKESKKKKEKRKIVVPQGDHFYSVEKQNLLSSKMQVCTIYITNNVFFKQNPLKIDFKKRPQEPNWISS